jgi:hypothetical protein
MAMSWSRAAKSLPPLADTAIVCGVALLVAIACLDEPSADTQDALFESDVTVPDRRPLTIARSSDAFPHMARTRRPA